MSEVLAQLEKKGGEDKLSSVVGIFGHDAYSTGNTFSAEKGAYYILQGGGNTSATQLIASASGAEIVSQSYYNTGPNLRMLCSLIKATSTSITISSSNSLNYYVFKLS